MDANNLKKVDINSIVKKALSDQLSLDIDKISDDALLVEELGCDSLEAIELIMTLEENMGSDPVDIQDYRLDTVRDVVEYVNNNMKK